MTDMAARLNAALEGRYAIERELGEGGMAQAYARRLLTLFVLSLAGCGGETKTPTETADPPVATTVTVSPTTLSFSSFGDTQQLTATVTDQNGAPMDGASVAWASSASSIASVSSVGLVTAVAWRDTRALKLSYQQADPATVLEVVSLESA